MNNRGRPRDQAMDEARAWSDGDRRASPRAIFFGVTARSVWREDRITHLRAYRGRSPRVWFIAGHGNRGMIGGRREALSSSGRKIRWKTR